MIVCSVCELLCDIVWCGLVVVIVCVRCMCLRVLRDVLCDVVGCVFVVAFICVGVLTICLLDVFVMCCVMVFGVCLCCVVILRVGFTVFVRVVTYCVTLYELCLCGCGCVCVCLFNVRVCCECEFLCDDACWIRCVVVIIYCLMRPRVVCDVVWLYDMLFVFVLLFVCVPCLRV